MASSSKKSDEFLPTIQFGFLLTDKGTSVLHQMWVTPMGLTEWRPVPIVELNESTRRPSIAGYLEEDDD